MKKLFIAFASMLFLAQFTNAQTVLIGGENFDGSSHGFTSTPAGAWQTTDYYSVSPSNAIAGFVPNIVGDEIILTSPPYNLTGYDNVVLKFNHICKISPSDITRIEYRISNGVWEEIDYGGYLGSANNYRMDGFNAGSYAKWKGNDSTAIPSAGWWQEELFDLSPNVGSQAGVQFRFALKHGNAQGSQVSYGWLIDDFAIYASQSTTIIPPSIKILGSYPINTVYRTGPYDLTFKIKSDTGLQLPLYLKYTSTFNNTSTTNSVALQRTGGDTLFTVALPQFKEGTDIRYSVTATDSANNSANFWGGYNIQRLANTASGYITVGTDAITNNEAPIGMNSAYSWSRQLYLAEEIDPVASSGGLITKLAWYCMSDINVIYDKQTCYFQITNDQYITNKLYVDPVANSAEKVWTGSLHIKKGWVEIELDKPFFLLPGQNLMVHWHNNNASNVSANWQHSITSIEMRASDEARNFPLTPSNNKNIFSTYRPNMRLYLQGGDYANNSATVSAIVSPTQQSFQVGQSNNIIVSVRNTGITNLKTAIISWQVNNGSVSSINWQGDLSWDNDSVVSLGSFMPRSDIYDTITVWVSMPNGVIDSSSWDDTLSAVFYGCPSGGISGSYTVGTGGDFATLDHAMEIVNRCGVANNIVFKFKSGVYNQGLNFLDFGSILGNYTLTITSEKNNRDSVIFRPTTGAAVKLGNSKNLVFDAVTFDMQHLNSSNSYGVYFMDACTNIVITNCAIFADSTKSNLSTTPIYKGGVGVVDNITIKNNLINGGNYSIQFIGSTGSNTAVYGKNVTIDSNILKNAWAGISISYTDLNSFSYNTIIRRIYVVPITGAPSGTMLTFSKTNGTIVGNKVYELSLLSSGGSHTAYSLTDHNRYNATEPALVANNQIMVATNGGFNGFNITSSKLRLYHNSILGTGAGATEMNGILVSNETDAYLDVQNNNIVLEYRAGRPVSIPSINFLNNYHFKSNNYAAPSFIGYVGSNVPDFSLWQVLFPEDITSVSIIPDFMNKATSLELSDYTGLECNLLGDVAMDIQNNRRNVTTAMGCYTSPSYTTDAALTAVLDWQEEAAANTSTTPKIVFTNGGNANINAATINWSFNSTLKTPVSLSKILVPGQSDTIPLQNITYGSYSNELKIWISSLNGGGATDENKKNDTLTVYSFACDSTLNGNYTIDPLSGNFKSITDAIHALYNCKINGPVTFLIADGIYNENISFEGRIPGSSSVNTVTFTSANGDAGLVTIKRIGETSMNNAAVVLNNVANIQFFKLTLDGRTHTESGTYFHAAMIESGCENIEIGNCILLNPSDYHITATHLNWAIVYNATGNIKNIRIVNNTMKGGSCGVYLNGTSAAPNNIILIQNNLIHFVDGWGIYATYTDSVLSYNNVIRQRTKPGLALAGFCGIYYSYFSGEIIGNKIYADLMSTGAIYLYSQNNVTKSSLIIPVINNEIIGYATAVSPQTNNGIYTGSGIKAAIYHNSILITGTSPARGICINANNDIKITAKNNNIAMLTSAADFPVYLGNTIAANWVNYVFDYNNYYSKTGKYVGYAGANKDSLRAWRATITSDTHSVVQKAYFNNTLNSLFPASTVGLACPQLTGIVDRDINGTLRPSTTLMGAYQHTSSSLDAHPQSIALSPSTLVAGTPSDIIISLYNAGTNTIDSVDIYWKANGVTTLTPYRHRVSFKADSTTLPITIGDFNPIAGNNEIIVWTSMPNNTTDNNIYNDTIKTSGHYACDTAMNGTYTIGNSGNYPDIESALAVLKNCGINGPVTFAFLPNEIHAASFSLGGIQGMNAINTLTFTSASGDASNTILQAKPSMNLMTFNDVQYLNINNLTLNARQGNKAIQFTGTNNNIEITNCVILLDTITNTASDARDGIHIASKTIIANNVRIVNNRIDGGNSGIYFQASGTNRVCDSNIITNTSTYGIYWRYGAAKSISNNIITSRTTNVAASWWGIGIGGGTDADIELINGNIIRTLTHDIKIPNGLNVQGSTGKMVISNNDIFLYAFSYAQGVYLSTTNIDLVSNSIYVESAGASTSAAGIYVSSLSLTVQLNIRNNNVIAGGATDNIFYIGSSSLPFLTSDYNNFYAVGNITSSTYPTLHPTLNDWQTGTRKDIHSVSILPNFININNSLEYIPTADFYCPLFPNILKDIKGNTRTTPSLMGAYTLSTGSLDMELSAIIDVPESKVMQGQTLNPRLVIKNTGLSNLDSAKIVCDYDGTQYTVTWKNGPLATLETDTIPLNVIPAVTSGNHQLKATIQSVNTSGLDVNPLNDTLKLNFTACSSLLSGTYTIGNSSADYTSIQEAINAIKTCGISNNIRLEIQSDTYTENIDLTNLGTIFNTDTLTITSVSGNAGDVIIRPASQEVVQMGNSKNILLDALTIDATNTGSHGIEFTDTCRNIAITNCILLADTLSFATNNQLIYKNNVRGTLNNITIANNVMNGGRSAIEINGGMKINDTYSNGSNIRIENNTILNTDTSGITLLYFNGTNSISYNKIVSRAINSVSQWRGINASTLSATYNANRVYQNNPAYSQSFGINLTGTGTASVYNNEIVGCGTTTVRGIHLAQSTNIAVNNSIYLKGSATEQVGIFIASSSLTVTNNNIVLEAEYGYPLYVGVSTVPTTGINFNNYYAPRYIGARGTNTSIATPTVTATDFPFWKTIFAFDIASAKVKPEFIDISQSLELSDYTGLYCNRNANVLKDINGVNRTELTTMGAYAITVSAEYDLSFVKIVEPANDVSSMCAPDYVSVRYAVQNTGLGTYRFEDDTLSLHLTIDGMKGIIDTTVLITTDSLSIFQSDTFDIIDFVDVSFAGDYHITAWISSKRDTNYSNDTLRMIYRTNKIALPYVEDFSTSDMPSLAVNNIAGTNGWHVEQGGGIIAPNFGTGMLTMNGSHGTISSLRIGQIELERTIRPQLDFWYEHDNREPLKRDQMVVRVTWNGGASEKVISEIMRYDATCTTPIWKQYIVDLSPYVDSACVVVHLDAYSYGGAQHIDKIAVTSSHNLALDTIWVTDYSLCALGGKEIKAVLSNTTNQRYDFDDFPTDLIFQMRGSATMDKTITLTGQREAFTSDTISFFTNVDFNIGNTYTMKAYISTALGDADRKDDTSRRTIAINPSLAVHIDQISRGTSNCLMGESPIQPTVNITNNGDVDISGIGILFRLDTGDAGTPPFYLDLKEVYNGTITPGSTYTHTFATNYLVPWKERYQVNAIAYLLCDSLSVNKEASVQECVDMDDLYMISIDKPIINTTDNVGSSIIIEATLANRSDITSFSQVNITALIKDRKGNETKFTEVISSIIPLDTIHHIFKTAYTVPNDSIYYITVYIDNQTKDNYLDNDTMTVKRTTDYIDNIKKINGMNIIMSQNMPNPATNSTKILYSIPEAGEVIFRIHSMTGQTLSNRVIQSESGDQSVEINTSHLASGIYMYSMEFKGQRITKRMSIKR